MKAITLTDLARLKKVLGMLGSDQDGEVLAAAKAATKIMKDNGLTWDEFFRKQVSASAPSGEVEEELEVDLKEMIESAFNELRGKVKGDFGQFIGSLEEQFSEKGYLTPAQRAPLFAAVQKRR